MSLIFYVPGGEGGFQPPNSGGGGGNELPEDAGGKICMIYLNDT